MSGPLRLTVAAMIATMCAAMSLAAVFASSGWVFPVIGAIVLVSGSCALIRWSPLPSFLEPLTAAAAVLVWVTWLYARTEARGGVIPDAASLSRLKVLARSGFHDVHKLPPPVPTHHGLVLITVLGVAVVALIVDLTTVTLRRSALAGVPLLALFTVCAATSKHGVNALAFAVAAAGFLVLLFADSRERVSRWGAAMGVGNNARPAPTRSAENELPSAPGSLGRRVGAAAIGISVIVPFAIPGLHAGFRGHGGDGSGSGSGGGSVTTIDPIVSVTHDLASSLNAPVLSYRSTSEAPGYLRMTSLDNLAEEAFTASALNAPVSARITNGLNVDSPSGQHVTTSIDVARGVSFRWLPMPTTATQVEAPGDWRYDPGTATTFSASNTTSGLHYTVVSSPNLPTPGQLANAPSSITGDPAADLAHPKINSAVRSLTNQLTAGANSKYDSALDIQRYLTSNRFRYTVTPPTPPGNVDPLAYFLLQSRAGFCQQYATAMAVMARLVGIPSRVAVGFTAGTRNPDGTWVVTTHDAHAWPELFFPDYGWLPFEPTPRGDGQAVTPAYARAVPNQHGEAATGNNNSEGPDPVVKPDTTKGNKGKSGAGADARSGSSAHASRTGLGAIAWLAVLVGALLLALLPAGARQLTRRRRLLQLHGSHPPPSAAWAELRDSAIDAGAPWTDGTSPRQAAAVLSRWLGSRVDVSQPLARLTRAEEVDRYAAAPGSAATSLPADVRELRRALRLRRTRRQAVRAALLPPSTMGRFRARRARVSEAIDKVHFTRVTSPSRLAATWPLSRTAKRQSR
jgi:transglutaminase-like putative cysteine protease